VDGKRIVACMTAGLALAGCSKPPRPIVVGAKNTTEQSILGEIVAQHIEKRLGVPVERRMKMDGTLILHESLVSGQVDVYPEYAGEALVTALKVAPGDDPDMANVRLRREYHDLQLAWLAPLGFRSGFAIVVRSGDAQAARIETLSDAARYAPGWTIGVTPEFMSRIDGYAALMRTYSLNVNRGPTPLAPSLLYTAMSEKQVNMVAGNVTDAALVSSGLKILRDDRGVFPALGAALAVREAALLERPGLQEALEKLAGKFPDKVMRQLNYEVEFERRPVRVVAAAFLRQAGL